MCPGDDGVVGVVAPARDFRVVEGIGTAGTVPRIGAFGAHLCPIRVRLAPAVGSKFRLADVGLFIDVGEGRRHARFAGDQAAVGFGADLRLWSALRVFVRPPPMFAQDSVDHLIQTDVFVIDAFARSFIAEPGNRNRPDRREQARQCYIRA